MINYYKKWEQLQKNFDEMYFSVCINGLSTGLADVYLGSCQSLMELFVETFFLNMTLT